MTAEEAWKYYKDSVNDSHLIDMFVAQYSSVINCTIAIIQQLNMTILVFAVRDTSR